MISQLKIGLSGKVYLLMYRGKSERCWPSRAVQVRLSNFRHTAIMQNSSRDFFYFFMYRLFTVSVYVSLWLITHSIQEELTSSISKHFHSNNAIEPLCA